MEYTADTPPRSFRGRSGRVYRVGGRNRGFMAHPSDVEKLLRLRMFRRVDVDKMTSEEATVTVEPKPKPGSVVTMPTPTGQATEAFIAQVERGPPSATLPPMPPIEKEASEGNGLPDPATLKVADIKGLDLDAGQWAALLKREQAGKNRQTALIFMEEKIHGQSKHANAAPA